VVASLSVVTKPANKNDRFSETSLAGAVMRIAADMSRKLIDEDHAIARM